MKQKRAAACLLAVLFVFLSLTGCSSASKFDVLAESIPQSLDPQLAATAAEKTAVVNLFEGLYRLAEDGTPQLAAAKEVDVSPDGRTYTFTLHRERWWDSYRRDGEQVTPPVTADDFVFAFQRIFTKSTGSPWAAEFSSIENAAAVLAGMLDPSALGVQAEDEYTLCIRLAQADPTFPQKLAGAGAMPCNRDFFDYAAGAYGLSYSYLLTNGPFSITYWVAGETLTMARGEEVKGWVNSVEFLPPEEESGSSFAQRYAAGTGSGALVGAEEDSPAFTLTTWGLLFNGTNNFLADADVRAALAGVALETQLPFEEYPHLQMAEGLVPPGVSAGQNSYRQEAGNALPAVQNPAGLMQAAVQRHAQQTGMEGYPTPPSLTVLLPDSGPYAALFDEIHAQWQRRLSCFFAVEQLPSEELEARVQSGSYDIALLPFYAETDDAAGMLTAFLETAGANGWQSDGLASAVNAALGETEDEPHTAHAAEAERLLLAQWPVAPLFYESNSFVTREAYAGLSVDPFGPVLEFSAAATAE